MAEQDSTTAKASSIKLWVSHHVKAKINHWIAKASPREVAGFGTIIESGTPGELILSDVFLAEQNNAVAEVTISLAGFEKILARCDAAGTTAAVRFQWHSHGKMGVFWSTTDIEAMTMYTEMTNAFIFGVYNERGESLHEAWFKVKPTGDAAAIMLRNNTVEVAYYTSLSVEERKALDAEYDELVTGPSAVHRAALPRRQSSNTDWMFGYGNARSRTAAAATADRETAREAARARFISQNEFHGPARVAAKFRDKFKTDISTANATRLVNLCKQLDCTVEDLFDFGTDLRKAECITELELMVKQLDEKDDAAAAASDAAAADTTADDEDSTFASSRFDLDNIDIDEDVEAAMEAGTDDPGIVQLALQRMHVEENNRLAMNAMRNAGIANEAGLSKHSKALTKRQKLRPTP